MRQHLDHARFSLFSLGILASAAIHLGVFGIFGHWSNAFTPARPIGTERGQVSIHVMAMAASEETIPEPHRETDEPRETEIPVAPMLAVSDENKSAPEALLVAPMRVETEARPVPKTSPKTEAPKQPKDVQQTAASPSEGSQESQGVIEEHQPRMAVNPAPPYPRDALLARHEGTVVLRVQIDIEGRVRLLSIQISSGFPSLDRSAADAVRNWAFHPARRGGIAVASEAFVPVEFSIRR